MAQRAALGPLTAAQKHLVAACLANDQKDSSSRSGTLKAVPIQLKKSNERIKSMDLTVNTHKSKTSSQGRATGGGRRDIKSIA